MVNERCAETVLRCIRVVTNFLNNVSNQKCSAGECCDLVLFSAPPLVPLAPRPHEIEQTAGRRYGPFC
jgi:hypothetical protein